ncbi:hypothetical protein ACEPAF_6856 [Sanghuangporus sanghuang]
MARTKLTSRRSSLSTAGVSHLKTALDTALSDKPKSKRLTRRKASGRKNSSSTLVSSSSEGEASDGEKRIRRKNPARFKRDKKTSDIVSDLVSREVTAAAYWSRYYQYGLQEDLEEAIKIDRESLKLESVDANDTDRCETRANLGVSLLDLFAKTRREETLTEAIELLEAAIKKLSARTSDSADDEPNIALPRAIVNLGNAYRMKAERSGSEEDLNRAITMHEDALMLTPGDHPEWDTEIRQNCLARSLMARGSPKDVERAMDLMSARRHVLAESPDATALPLRNSRLYGFDIDIGLPVPDLSNLIRRLTDFPSSCGGFADIFMGEWNKTRRLKQKVAIKVLRPHALNPKEKTISERINKMLRAEIRVWHGLDHPNIVRLLGTCKGFSPYSSMILPWFANGSLSSFLHKHKSLIYGERLRLIREVASGLAYLHSHAIIHGDLTGANVLIDNDHRACLSDFGLSVLARDFDLPSMSRFTSGVGGSVRWTAPELYTFEGATPPRLTLHSDVYSFGSVAYEIISGEMPYSGIQNEMEVLLNYVVAGTPPERPTGGNTVEDEHWDAISRCWAKEPQTRPSSKTLTLKFEVKA